MEEAGYRPPDLDDDELKRLLTDRFQDNELGLLVFAFKLALRRLVEKAKGRLVRKKKQLGELVHHRYQWRDAA